MIIVQYQYKKDLKAALGQKLKFQETSFFGPEYNANGYFNVTNEKRSWYATVHMKNDKIVRVD